MAAIECKVKTQHSRGLWEEINSLISQFTKSYKMRILKRPTIKQPNDI